MNHRIFFPLLLLLAFGHLILAQKVSVDVSYKMKKHRAFKFKVGRPVEFTLKMKDEIFEAKPITKDLRQWEIRSNGYLAEATFHSNELEGIWWEIASADVTTRVLLSKDPTDINDPREFVITSDADRGKFMVFNDEPDCNSEFTLVEPADSPTLLTGVMRTYGTLISKDPCEKGKWKVNLENEPPDHVLIGWIFASIQSINVRFL